MIGESTDAAQYLDLCVWNPVRRRNLVGDPRRNEFCWFCTDTDDRFRDVVDAVEESTSRVMTPVQHRVTLCINRMQSKERFHRSIIYNHTIEITQPDFSSIMSFYDKIRNDKKYNFWHSVKIEKSLEISE